MEIPWSEKVNMLSINPDAATRDDVANMAATIQELESENTRLREALEFYAQREHYPDAWTGNSELNRDGGKLARQALSHSKPDAEVNG